MDKKQKKIKQEFDNHNWYTDHKEITDSFMQGLENGLEFSYVEYARAERAYQGLRD